jgi:hypothetical protein
MNHALRRLNSEGMRIFNEYILSGAQGDAPRALLESSATSEALSSSVSITDKPFKDRYEFGLYLHSLLSGFDTATITGDRNFWTSLALVWFDRVCPKDSMGNREVGEPYRYILSDNYRNYYRHLIRSPWYLIQQHGSNARFLLIAPKQSEYPLSVNGEIIEQFGGRQQVLASKPIIAAANMMYLDPASGRPRRGVAGSGRGSARRFGVVLRQLELTYDAGAMTEAGLIDILPTEFDTWKKPLEELRVEAIPA